MSVQDFRTVDPDAPIETDLCIIGSGFAGWTIAEELRDSGLQILIVESGGTKPEPDSDALNEFECVGVPLWKDGRSRILGGTSEIWTGRCIPLDDDDYEPHPWVPLSGWPFGSKTIAPYLDRASTYLGARPYGSGGLGPATGGRTARPDVDAALLSHVCWQYSQGAEKQKPTRLRSDLLTRRSSNLRILVHATVTHLNTDPSGTNFESVEIADPQGKRATVRARAAVLCTGGIENARILLYSNRTLPNGLGNSYDIVGRFLMDHPHTAEPLIRFDPRERARIHALFGPYAVSSTHGKHMFIEGLALSPELRRREGLLTCTAWPEELYAADDPVTAAKRLASGSRSEMVRDFASIVAQPGLVLGALHAKLTKRLVARKVDQIGLIARSDQRPDPDSRIRLSDRRDRLGLPMPQIDWRIGVQERASFAALARAIASEFRRLGLPHVELAHWVREGRHDEAVLVDSCHPSGTTRMVSDVRYGVVDQDCQVHGVAHLYVAGSSVFPTVGHANPTLMIAALAIRLAHHLRTRLSADAAAASARRPSDVLTAG
ncbi:MAG: GMC family oxidoreductase [Alphaproteobacteria bacterium]|nr:GMC family oxidoreductase [Alphaproteobacteria bacterium]